LPADDLVDRRPDREPIGPFETGRRVEGDEELRDAEGAEEADEVAGIEAVRAAAGGRRRPGEVTISRSRSPSSV
jgi:hypothetical protein